MGNSTKGAVFYRALLALTVFLLLVLVGTGIIWAQESFTIEIWSPSHSKFGVEVDLLSPTADVSVPFALGESVTFSFEKGSDELVQWDIKVWKDTLGENPTVNKEVSWDFGDGAAGSGLEVTHAYSAEGDFTINLSWTIWIINEAAKTSLNNSGEVKLNLHVRTAPPTPVPTDTPAPQPTATDTPLPQPTAAATDTPTPKQVATDTPAPELEITDTPTLEPEPTATPISPSTPVAMATSRPKPAPTSSPRFKLPSPSANILAYIAVASFGGAAMLGLLALWTWMRGG